MSLHQPMLHLIKKTVSFATQSLENSFGIPLDLSYITDEVLCCSFPTSQFPSKYYRNNIQDLVKYLNLKHGEERWKLFSLRTQHKNEYDENAEYLKGKFVNFPWKDHEGPPFPYLLRVLDAIEDHVSKERGYVAVIHCRMGKGRSGLIAATYLMYKKGMSKQEAENIFTQKRMTFGFGEGISIKSQMKYCDYMRIFCESTNTIYEPIGISGIKIKFIGSKFQSNDSLIQVKVSGYDFKENDIEPVLLRDSLKDIKPNIVEASINQSENFSDIRISVHMDWLGFKVTTVYLWFNVFFELQIAGKSKIVKYRWEEFDGLKGTGKKGFKLFDEMELHF